MADFGSGGLHGYCWLKKGRNQNTTPLHPYQAPTRIHTEARARATPTRPTTRLPQIGKYARVRPPPAPRGAFVDLGRMVVGLVGAASGLASAWILVGVRSGCGG